MHLNNDYSCIYLPSDNILTFLNTIWNDRQNFVIVESKGFRVKTKFAKADKKLGLKSLTHPGEVTFESVRDVVLAQILQRAHPPFQPPRKEG